MGITEWFKWITNNLDVNVDLIVYLRTDPDVVHRRILNRARQEEKTVPLSYIEDLHKIHEDWLHYQTTHAVPAPVIEIDANVELPEMLQQISHVKDQILNRKMEEIRSIYSYQIVSPFFQLIIIMF